jgi:outer membrane receptor for ferrienterochelin and colicins
MRTSPLKLASLLLFLFIQYSGFSQKVTGKVYGHFGKEKESLIGAVVAFSGSNSVSVSDVNGYFEIPYQKGILVASFSGFEPDSFKVVVPVHLEFTLKNNQLDEIIIEERVKSIELDRKSATLNYNIGKKELEKAACCNLSESFETNAAIDASFTDAVTGTRQIELLGLAGKYSQIQLEMTPFVRGIQANYGLTHIPGFWITSMQLSKGAGSVANGFESMTGAINVELAKPDFDSKLALNVYANASGRYEFNAISAFPVNEKWSTALLLHGNMRTQKNDRNDDGFLDMPLSSSINFLNRWKYSGGNGLNSQFGVRLISEELRGGQVAHIHNGFNDVSPKTWGSNLKTEHYELFGKVGKLLNTPGQSVGFIYSFTQQKMNGYFGDNTLKSNQNSIYLNLLFQTYLNSSEHTLKSGISYQLDSYNKTVAAFLTDDVYAPIYRNSIPGVFTEYTWNPSEKFSLIGGLRADYKEDIGVFISPRFNMRFAPNLNNTFRLGVGRGHRFANSPEENISIFASSRQPQMNTLDFWQSTNNSRENSWNIGLSYVSEFKLNYRRGVFMVDYFYTYFNNKIVKDFDLSPQTIGLYNVENGSYSSTFSVQVDYELAKRLDFRLAYKYQDVQTNFESIGWAKDPFIPTSRVLVNLAYQTRNEWKFDVTWNWYDTKRIPSTESNPPEFHFGTKSPTLNMVSAQITKTFGKFDIYVGGENLLNERQNDAIIDPENPFGTYFDSQLVWGPIFGRNVYIGANFKL